MVALTGREIVRFEGRFSTTDGTTQDIANLASGSGSTLPATPEGYGITIDRTGTTDATSALNAFLQALIVNGDEGYLGAGIFKTSGEVLISGTGPSFGGLSGAGGRCIIRPSSGHSYHGFRANITGEFLRKSSINGLTIQGQGAIPGDGKAGFIMDATTLLPATNIEVSGFDIGFDFINNCYNSSLWSPSVPRFASCNCGINIREGAQSGSDLSFYNSQLHAEKMAVNIIGNGGGYHFFGGQWGAQDLTFTAQDTARGVLTVGKTYVANGSGSQLDNLRTVILKGIAFEGWRGIPAVRWYGDNSMSFEGCSFTATANQAGQQATEIFRATGLGNSIIGWNNNTIGQSHFYNATLANLSGATDFFAMNEMAWEALAGTIVGEGSTPATFGANSFFTLSIQSNYAGNQYQTGLGQYIDSAGGGNYPALALGGGRFRWHWNGNTLQKSNDNGGTWSDI